MHERLLLFCWTAAGGIFLGGIGALFGGLAGFMARLHGRMPGGYVGWRVLRAVERVLRRELPSRQAGVLIGAFDGASFLGVIGALLGLLAGWGDWISTGPLLAIVLGFAVVAGLAVTLGMTALVLARGGMVVFGTACIGGLAGIYIGALVADSAGIMAGAWIGLMLGFLIGWLGPRGHARGKHRNRIRNNFKEPEL